jgi:formylglycine-generating enzyme required for sulfatase activity
MTRWLQSYISPNDKLAMRLKAAIKRQHPASEVRSGGEPIPAARAFREWRSECDRAREAWEKKVARGKSGSLLTGSALVEAQDWLAKRAEDTGEATRTFISASRKAAQRREVRAHALIGVLGAAVALTNATGVLVAQERALKPGDSLPTECRDCPEMVVVPAGRFMMGSQNEGGGSARPQHEVTIAEPFAVAKVPLTFDEWDACARNGPCDRDVSDNGWGRGRRPVINVSWDDAQTYVKWLSKITGNEYRLLSESEYEYSARAGSQRIYSWGDDIKLNGQPMANCMLCGSPWDGKQTAPVCGWQEGDQQKSPGCSFPANAFGLYDMAGNVWEWTNDCWNPKYEGAPVDGSPWTSGDCSLRVVRGGSWDSDPDDLRGGDRYMNYTDARVFNFGFRVARTLFAERKP